MKVASFYTVSEDHMRKSAARTWKLRDHWASKNRTHRQVEAKRDFGPPRPPSMTLCLRRADGLKRFRFRNRGPQPPKLTATCW
jgi:hypothetical protein